jgi:methionine synthase I (cobalamin-dependent)
MTGFLEAISSRKLLFDGGLGSMLIDTGLADGEAPDLWTMNRPDVVEDIHRQYIEAGADVIQTNTFGSTALKLAASARGDEVPLVEEINRKAVELARKAMAEMAPDRCFLAGDIGPTGAFFPPMGTLTAEAARAAFHRQAAALSEAGVDLFLIETMYDLREAVEAVRAVREVSEKPIVCELTMERKKRGYFTMVGDTVAVAVAKLPATGADVLGANCSITSSEMIDLVSQFRAATDMPLLFQPNAGQPEVRGGKTVYRQDPGEFASDMKKVLDSGANAVGGCCGTNPEFIRAVRDLIGT